MIRVVRLPSAEAAGTAAATHIADTLAAVLATRATASIALSGGRSPAPMLRHLATRSLDWSAVQVFQVDERVVPEDDSERNLSGIREMFAGRVPAWLHPMPVGPGDLEPAARAYEAELPDALDLVHLGLGPDGHTASLFPGDPVLDVTDRRVAVTAPHVGHRRMTLTFAALDTAAARVWLVSGDDKRDALTRLLASDPSIPAGRVTTENAVLFTDLTVAGVGTVGA